MLVGQPEYLGIYETDFVFCEGLRGGIVENGRDGFLELCDSYIRDERSL